MFRVVYFDGISVKDVWFETDREALKFSTLNLRYKILEWKKYDNKASARPLETYPV